MQQEHNFDHPELNFHFQNTLNWPEYFRFANNGRDKTSKSVDEYCKQAQLLLEACGKIAHGHLRENAQVMDSLDLSEADGLLSSNLRALQPSLQAIKKSLERSYLSGQLPFALQPLVWEQLGRVCPTTMLKVGLSSILADLFEAHASYPLKETYLPQIKAGISSLCLAISEFDSDYDLAKLDCYGAKQPDGSWRLNGQKRAVFAADADLCLVLAKNEKGSQGLSALSLYFCPRFLNGEQNYRDSKRPAATSFRAIPCGDFQFENTRAWLLGDEGEGFAILHPALENIRLALAMQAISLLDEISQLTKTCSMHRQEAFSSSLIAGAGLPVSSGLERLNEALQLDLIALRSLAYHLINDQSLSILGSSFVRDELVPFHDKNDEQKSIIINKTRFSRRLPLLKIAATNLCIKHGVRLLQFLGPYATSQELPIERMVREALALPCLGGANHELAILHVRKQLKGILAKPKKFISTHLQEKVKATTSNDFLRRKWYKIRHISRSAYISLLINSVAHAPRVTTQDIDGKQWLHILRTYVGDVNIYTQTVRDNAAYICEIQSLCAMSDALIKDSIKDPMREVIARKFLSQALTRVNYLYQKISIHGSSRLTSHEIGFAVTATPLMHGAKP